MVSAHPDGYRKHLILRLKQLDWAVFGLVLLGVIWVTKHADNPTVMIRWRFRDYASNPARFATTWNTGPNRDLSMVLKCQLKTIELAKGVLAFSKWDLRASCAAALGVLCRCYFLIFFHIHRTRVAAAGGVLWSLRFPSPRKVDTAFAVSIR